MDWRRRAAESRLWRGLSIVPRSVPAHETIVAAGLARQTRLRPRLILHALARPGFTSIGSGGEVAEGVKKCVIPYIPKSGGWAGS